MEDYWQGKIMEERKFYDDQVQVSESHFKELEVRMKEYEELLTMESVKNNGVLDTIDEDRNMEEKVVEWEEEITHLNHTIEQLEVGYEQKINEMREKLTILESGASQCKCGELSVKRRNLESFWMKVVKSDVGPLSLPSVLFMRGASDSKKSSDSGFINDDLNTGDSKQDVFTQVPHISDTDKQDRLESSVCVAYRGILADIAREMNDIGSDSVDGDTDGDTNIICRLSQVTRRCYQLQYNLHQTKGQCETNITGGQTLC